MELFDKLCSDELQSYWFECQSSCAYIILDVWVTVSQHFHNLIYDVFFISDIPVLVLEFELDFFQSVDVFCWAFATY